MLLQEFWSDRFWPYCVDNLRESTCVGYESAWRLHVAPRFGAMQMESISVELVDKWLAGFGSSGAARKAWAVLRAILRKAIRWNLLDVDITRRDIQLPAKPHYEPRILSIRQQRTLLQGFYGHPLEAWLICAVSCGLRTEEGYGLEWGDLDLRRGVLHVERGLQWVAGHEAVVPPKTELSRRTLPLPRFAVKRLAELRHGTKTGRLVGGLNANQVANHYRSWCKRVKLPSFCVRVRRPSGRWGITLVCSGSRCTVSACSTVRLLRFPRSSWETKGAAPCVPPRNLRHTFGTLAIKAGTDISVVARQLGHSDIQTTARYYLKPDLSVLKDMQKTWQKLILTC